MKLQCQKTLQIETMLRQEVSGSKRFCQHIKCYGREKYGIDEVLSNIEVYNEEDIVSFKDRIMELAANASLITGTENLNHEIKRGIINKKW
ncbi:hypothetical protein RhiirC2_771465 [Rhizophagus irregularis]|uniref:Uncharacterized protein n=1 Tax=Rhizophagus irregularis TaxID=588596 RepID=A0A2N1NTV4_9GLOM|nr:hypothetical protein RhiirC2_771465 [Rhizophagus irregularis]